MNFRLAQNTDRKQLYSLWEKTFGDDSETIDKFFSAVITDENTVVCANGEKIVSALYLLPANLKTQSETLSAYCIYAAATDEAYRKQGIMSSLIEFSCEIAKSRNIDFIFLRPANAKLFSYYEKCGFEKAFYFKENVELEEIPSSYSYGYINWNEAVVNLNALFSDNQSFFSENGYADYYEKNNELFVNAFVSGNIKELLSELKKKNQNKKIYVDLPVSAGDGLSAQGMIRKLSKKNFSGCAYMGITLE